MKKIVLAAIVGIAAFLSSSAQAQTTASSTFNVTIALTSACTVSPVAPVAFAYTSFQAAVSTATGGTFTVTCTSGAAYTLGLQAGAGAPVAPGAAHINVTDNFLNLAYALTLPGTNFTGTGALQNYTVAGTMAGNQGGTCATSTCNNGAATNAVQTLIIVF